ncbi:hypothetical protein [Micromonospora lupini]|uniref:Uncharacterized protein n=1 Tax=Micromonospora lupini str. Lupac 08 TaxID=1150864 RepID=I0LAZ1_9ACTN|nr:hypothetical protein [Micromonospora lupini]CCH20988.1 hypothetical protein MILUP08_45883 [Micromonospora lupini str. Lupac 08]
MGYGPSRGCGNPDTGPELEPGGRRPADGPDTGVRAPPPEREPGGLRTAGNHHAGVRAPPPELGPGGLRPADGPDTGVRAPPPERGPGGVQAVDGDDAEVTVTGSDRPAGRDVDMGCLLDWGTVLPPCDGRAGRWKPNRSGTTRYVTVC